MPTFNTQADLLAEGESLFAAMTANAADLAHLDGSRQKLEGMLSQMRELLMQQRVHMAAKQETSKQLGDLFRNGSKLITFLRKGVVEHYGSESEKLVEFKIQPFRGRRPAGPATPPPPAVE